MRGDARDHRHRGRSSSCCSIRWAATRGIGDAERVKHWLETGDAQALPKAKAAPARPAVKTRVKGTVNPVSRSKPTTKLRKVGG